MLSYIEFLRCRSFLVIFAIFIGLAFAAHLVNVSSSSVFGMLFGIGPVVVLLGVSLHEASLNRDVVCIQPLPRWRIALGYVLVDTLLLSLILGMPLAFLSYSFARQMSVSEGTFLVGVFFFLYGVSQLVMSWSGQHIMIVRGVLLMLTIIGTSAVTVGYVVVHSVRAHHHFSSPAPSVAPWLIMVTWCGALALIAVAVTSWERAQRLT